MGLSNTTVDDTDSDIGFYTTVIVEGTCIDSSLNARKILILNMTFINYLTLYYLFMDLAVFPVKRYSAALSASRPVRYALQK